VTKIIKTSTPGKEKNRLSKAIVITIREFMRMQEPNNTTKDMLAFVILALEEIASGIDKSVSAWEKRGYWVKADKYRMEWHWTEVVAKRLKKAFSNNEWDEITNILVQIMGRFDNIKVSDNHRMGKPWLNAYVAFKKLNDYQE